MSNQVKNIIFSKHALERSKDRSVNKHLIADIIRSPYKIINLEDDKKKFLKTVRNRKYQVIATYLKNEHKWLVISIWVRGEEDKPSLLWQMLQSLGRLIKKLFG